MFVIPAMTVLCTAGVAFYVRFLVALCKESLAPDFGCAGKPNEAWEQVPQQERNRLVAAARLAPMDLASTVKEREDSRRYFAKPGEAEWGC